MINIQPDIALRRCSVARATPSYLLTFHIFIMEKLSLRVRVVLAALALLIGSFALAAAAFATSAPALSIAPVSTTATSTTYAITLTNNGDHFNVVEFSLHFASSTPLTIGTIESELCRPELTIANTLSTTTGAWYVACGNYLPFSGASTTIATFSIPHTASTTLAFGTSTALYRHDGLGTQIFPLTVGTSTKTIW